MVQEIRHCDTGAYGMTENLGAVCMMPSEAIKDGYVGRLYPGMEVK